MDEKKTVYTLYSEEKRKVILTIFHRLADCIKLENNSNFVEIFSVIDGNGVINLENGECIDFNSGDSFIFDSCRNCEIVFESSVEFFSLRFNLSDFMDGSYISVFDKDIIERFFGLLKILHKRLILCILIPEKSWKVCS